MFVRLALSWRASLHLLIMALSKKDIYNNALSKVSRKRISSVDDGSFEANLCNDLFPKALNDALYEHAWGSCRKFAKLVAKSATPIHSFEYAYQLPNDYVRIIQAYYAESKHYFDFLWEIQGDTLLTSRDEVYIKYIHVPENIEILNTALANVVVYKLAMALCFPMQADGDRENQLMQQYEQIALPRAKAQDSMETRNLEYEEEPWIESLNKNGI